MEHTAAEYNSTELGTGPWKSAQSRSGSASSRRVRAARGLLVRGETPINYVAAQACRPWGDDATRPGVRALTRPSGSRWSSSPTAINPADTTRSIRSRAASSAGGQPAAEQLSGSGSARRASASARSAPLSSRRMVCTNSCSRCPTAHPASGCSGCYRCTPSDSCWAACGRLPRRGATAPRAAPDRGIRAADSARASRRRATSSRSAGRPTPPRTRRASASTACEWPRRSGSTTSSWRRVDRSR